MEEIFLYKSNNKEAARIQSESTPEYTSSTRVRKTIIRLYKKRVQYALSRILHRNFYHFLQGHDNKIFVHTHQRCQ